MKTDEYRPKFVFEVSEEQKARADKLLNTYGIRKAVFNIVLDDVLDLIEEYGGVVIGAILSKNLKPRDVIPSLKNASKTGEKTSG